MNLKLIISILILCFSLQSQAQRSKLKRDYSIITFLDGKELKGKIVSLRNNGQVYYWKTKKAKKQKFNPSLIKKVTDFYFYFENKIRKTYSVDYVYYQIRGSYKQLEVIIEGKINLLMFENFSNNSNYIFRDYYGKRDDEKSITFLSSKKMSQKKFINISSNYFKDCPNLISEIKNKIYTHKDIVKIIKFYNRECN